MKDEYLRTIGYRIIKKVSLLLKKYVNLNNIDNVVGKGYGGDYSFKIDTLIEEYIINQLKEFGLKLLIVSEENGLLKTSSDIEYIVLIDPLDGSINYVSKIPVVSTSIVFYSVDKPYLNSALAGVVSNVFLNEIYSFNSSNVFINENKISSIERKIRGLVSIYTEDPSIVLKIKSFNKNYLKTDVKIRTLGSSSIESIYAALNRIDLFLHNTSKLRNIDIAGGVALANLLKTPCIDLRGEEIKHRVDDIVNIESIVIGIYANELTEKSCKYSINTTTQYFNTSFSY